MLLKLRASTMYLLVVRGTTPEVAPNTKKN